MEKTMRILGAVILVLILLEACTSDQGYTSRGKLGPTFGTGIVTDIIKGG